MNFTKINLFKHQHPIYFINSHQKGEFMFPFDILLQMIYFSTYTMYQIAKSNKKRLLFTFKNFKLRNNRAVRTYD